VIANIVLFERGNDAGISIVCVIGLAAFSEFSMHVDNL
jgi:hypothetical protein